MTLDFFQVLTEVAVGELRVFQVNKEEFPGALTGEAFVFVSGVVTDIGPRWVAIDHTIISDPDWNNHIHEQYEGTETAWAYRELLAVF